MKVIKLYQCEICNARYGTQNEAVECEKRGMMEALPVGLIYGNPLGESHYKGMTFCICKSEPEGHYRCDTLWACRDRGDSLGKETCGNGGMAHIGPSDAAVPSHHTFQRMVRFLIAQGIKPLMWNGHCAVNVPQDVLPQNEVVEGK